MGRAATYAITPRRFCAAISAGPGRSSISASRRCACGQPSRSGSTSVPRRCSGSSRAPAPRRAKCTVSEAAARTAASSASGDCGARGSSTTSGRESASEISLRSISPAPRAKAGQWMREAGAPSRWGRRPSISVSATAVSEARACACSPSSPPAVAVTGSTRGSTSSSSGSPPVTTRWASPNGSRSTSAGGGSTRRPRRPNVTSTRTRARRRPALKRTGSGSSGSSIQPGGSGRRPATASIRMLSGCSSTTLRVSRWRSTLAPHAPAEIHAAAPAPSSSSAEPVTYSGSASNVPATSSNRRPRVAHPSAERTPGSLERRRRRDRVGDDLGPPHPRGLGHEHDAVREHDARQLLDVVGQRVVAAAQERARPGGAQQHEAGARRGAELHAVVAARVVQERDDVVAQRLRGVHAAGGVLALEHLGSVGDRLEVEHAVATLVALEHPRLLRGARVAELEPDHEAVDLRLRERVGALVLDRVLRGEDEERAGELVRVDVDGHHPLLHALEQAGLGLRRGAVDLVDDHDVREDRARAELEALLALVVDAGADDVGRQQVGGALDARELRVDRLRQRACERGLADARIVLDEDVPFGEHRDDDVLEHVVAHLDRAADVLLHALGHLGRPLGLLGPDGVGTTPLDWLHQLLTFTSEDERRLNTASRTFAATAALVARGTCVSPSAVTIVTSLSGASNAIPGAETSLTTTASRRLRSSLPRACSTAPAPDSAAKPTSSWPGRRSAASAVSTSSVCSSSSVRVSPASAFLILSARASAGR